MKKVTACRPKINEIGRKILKTQIGLNNLEPNIRNVDKKKCRA